MVVTVEIPPGKTHPIRFRLGRLAVQVTRVLDCWWAEGGRYLRILGDDGDLYVLEERAGQEVWELVSFTEKRSMGSVFPPRRGRTLH